MRYFIVHSCEKKLKKERLDHELLFLLEKQIIQQQQCVSYGSGLYKVRLARGGEGKSGGYRICIAYKTSERLVMLYMFAKNEKDNLSTSQRRILKIESEKILSLKEEDIHYLLRTGKLIEVIHAE